MNSETFNNSKVLITGGLGFIGSNLARRLVDLQAKITIVDASLPEYGANKFNFASLEDKIEFVQADVRDEALIASLVKDKNYIFDLAAQVSYLDSSQKPLLDLDINCRSKLILLEACRVHNPEVKIVFTSSRLVYGKIEKIPVPETHPTNPLSLYGIHKLTAEKYFTNYFQNFRIKSAVARVPNPFGPRAQAKHSRYGIVGWFIRQALEGKEIQIFGDGTQVRDYIYIDDLVEALLALAGSDKTNGQVYNVGSGSGASFKSMAETIVKIVGQGSIVSIPWPENYEKNETGDYLADLNKIKTETNWQAGTSFEAGVKKTVEFYRQNFEHYF